jgi:hypothetical protein
VAKTKKKTTSQKKATSANTKRKTSAPKQSVNTESKKSAGQKKQDSPDVKKQDDAGVLVRVKHFFKRVIALPKSKKST